MCGENRDGNTAGESHNYGIGNELYDGAQLQKSEEQQEHSSHERGYGEPLHAVLLYYTIYYYDESSGGSAYLYLAASCHRDDEACHYGGDDAFLRCHSRGYAEGYGKRQSHDAHYHSCHDISHEGLPVVVSER